MLTSSSPRTRAFISYSHADARELQRLRIHLAPYVRSEGLDVWDDTKIIPGSDWREEIKQAIASAKVAVLLVSADFLASDFIAKNELPPLLLAAKQEGAVILSVILKPCAFKYTELVQYQAANDPSQPLLRATEIEQEETWVKVAELIRTSLSAPNSNGLSQSTVSTSKLETLPVEPSTGDVRMPLLPGIRVRQGTKEGWLEIARQLFFKDGQEEDVIAACDKAIEIDPTYGVAYEYKGDALVRLKEYEKALPVYETRIDLASNADGSPFIDKAWMYAKLGDILRNLKRYGEALAAYGTALHLSFHHLPSYIGKGDMLWALKCYEEALSYYEKGIYLDPGRAWEEINTEGKELQNDPIGYRSALAACGAFIRYVPKDSSPYFRKAIFLYKLKRYKEILPLYDHIIRLAPNNLAIIHISKGLVLQNLGRYQEALQAYEQAIAHTSNEFLDSNIFAWRKMGDILKLLGRSIESEEAYEKVNLLEIPF